jgi:serine/threonine protein kinase
MLTRYRLLERIGGGSYADVYKAEDAWSHILVAVKILRDGAGTPPDEKA